MSLDTEAKHRIRTAVVAAIVFAVSGAAAYMLFRSFREANEAPHLSRVEEPLPLPEYDFAYSSNKDGDYDLYLATLDGSLELRLTDDPLDEQQPAWSPDGTLIAYVLSDEGIRSDIWVTAVTEGKTRNLTSTPAGQDGNPSWSPDGTRLAFTSESAITVVGLDGSNLRQLTGGSATDFQPSWSPDGKRIVFSRHVRNDAENSGIWIMDDSGGTQERVSEISVFAQNPVWSPDGRSIAFVGAETRGPAQIYVLDVASRAIRLLTTDGTNKSGPSWSPDSQHILYAADNEGQTDLYVAPADGTKTSSVISGAADDVTPAWNPAAAGSK